MVGRNLGDWSSDVPLRFTKHAATHDDLGRHEVSPSSRDLDCDVDADAVNPAELLQERMSNRERNYELRDNLGLTCGVEGEVTRVVHDRGHPRTVRAEDGLARPE